ncbi:MAG: glycosyltransferase family 2 protein [Gammaproteobacteria bacterium]
MPSDNHLKLSIAVVCYNTPAAQLRALFDSLAASLETLRRYNSLATATVTLVDNSHQPVSVLRDLIAESTLGSPEQLVVRILSGQGNIGFARAHNLALENLDSDYHLVLNPDVVLDRNALVEGVSYLEQSREAVLLSPYTENESGQQQFLCKRYPSVFLFVLRGFFPGFLKSLFAKPLAKFEMRDLDNEQATKNIPIASGAFMFCRSQSLLAIGGFNPAYFLYFEDFDLSLRISKIGKIVYLPSMKIVHHGGNSAAKGWRHIRMFLRSGIRFFNSHGWRLI